MRPPRRRSPGNRGQRQHAADRFLPAWAHTIRVRTDGKPAPVDPARTARRDGWCRRGICIPPASRASRAMRSTSVARSWMIRGHGQLSGTGAPETNAGDMRQFPSGPWGPAHLTCVNALHGSCRHGTVGKASRHLELAVAEHTGIISFVGAEPVHRPGTRAWQRRWGAVSTPAISPACPGGAHDQDDRPSPGRCPGRHLSRQRSALLHGDRDSRRATRPPFLRRRFGRYARRSTAGTPAAPAPQDPLTAPACRVAAWIG